MAKSAVLPSLLDRFERRYRTDHQQEHALLLDAAGQIVTQRDGAFDSVSFDPTELERAYGGTVTHSHPRSLPPSGADLSLAARYGLTLRAVGLAPDTGDAWDHTVRFPRPDSALADALSAAFADAVEQAEKELARAPLADLAWQRESRHRAVTRLAQEHGFAYQRVLYGRLSEATRHERARLAVLTHADEVLRREVFAVLAGQIISDILHLVRGGTVPMAALPQVRESVNRHVQRVMLGAPQHDGSLVPFTTQDGQAVPRSLYFRVLFGLLHSSASTAIARHADMMRRYLPPDLIHALEYALVSPFDTALTEEEGPRYDPLHLWLGPGGKRLSDRIWNAAGEMRVRLHGYLDVAIAQQMPLEQMAKGLEQFLVEGKGSYEAMRLARTEVSAAYHRADALAAQRNPLVEMYTPTVAPTHGCCDECDYEEQHGPYAKSDFTHLPPFHPECICTVIWHVVENVKATVAILRDQIAQAVGAAKRSFADIIGPLSKKFLTLLFGRRA